MPDIWPRGGQLPPRLPETAYPPVLRRESLGPCAEAFPLEESLEKPTASPPFSPSLSLSFSRPVSTGAFPAARAAYPL